VSNSPTGNDEFDQQVRPRDEPSTRLVEESVNGPRRFLYVVIAIFTFTALGFSSASTFYITRDGAGSKNGSSLANAAACDSTPGVAQSTCAAFNNSSNWGSGSNQIGPGTVVHLGGDGVAITATAGASGYLAFQRSGTSGNVIELLFDSGFSSSGLNAPYWCCALGGGAISLNGNQYVLIDGGTSQPCGWNTATNASEGTCNGTIQATANGDGLTYQQESVAIFSSSGCNNLEIRNLGIYNMYVKSSPAVGGPSNSMDVFCDNDTTNFLLHDIQMHDMETALVFVPFTSSNSSIQIYNNDVYNMNWGYIIGAGNGPITLTNVSISGNHIHDMANWTTASNQYHHDGMYFYYASCSGGGCLHFYNLMVYNNIFDGNNTNGACSGCDMTSYWFTDQTDAYDSAYIFNNVFVATDNTPSGAGPFLLGVSPYSGTILIANNTLACPASGGGHTNMGAMGNDANGGPTGFTVKNNLFAQCARWINCTGSEGCTYAASGLNNNIYATGNGGNLWDYHGNFTGALTGWQGMTGQDGDAASTSGSPGLGGSYENNSRSPLAGIVPQSGSVAQGAGANLTSLGIAALNSDITGAARPPSGAWDSGAVQSGSGGNQPAPPTDLTAVVN
jgi:hypothetical protein